MSPPCPIPHHVTYALQRMGPPLLLWGPPAQARYDMEQVLRDFPNLQATHLDLFVKPYHLNPSARYTLSRLALYLIGEPGENLRRQVCSPHNEWPSHL